MIAFGLGLLSLGAGSAWFYRSFGDELSISELWIDVYRWSAIAIGLVGGALALTGILRWIAVDLL